MKAFKTVSIKATEKDCPYKSPDIEVTEADFGLALCLSGNHEYITEEDW